MTYNEFKELLEIHNIEIDKFVINNIDEKIEFPKQAGRNWFENTNLWYQVFINPELKEAQTYLLKNYFDAVIDTKIFTNTFFPLVQEGRLKAKKVMELFKKAVAIKKDHLDYESILYHSIGPKRSLFRQLLSFYKKNDIYIINHLDNDKTPVVDTSEKMIVNNVHIGKDYGNIENGTAIIDCASKGYTQILRLLLDNGGDANTRENTPLLVAVKNGNYSCALLLLQNGANIHAKGDLVYKTFLRNEDRRWCPKGEEQSHNTLLYLFKSNECKSGREKVVNTNG